LLLTDDALVDRLAERVQPPAAENAEGVHHQVSAHSSALNNNKD